MSWSSISKYRCPLMGIAILWVVWFHSGLTFTNMAIMTFLQKIGYGGVDVFFFLSGFSLYYSLHKKDFSLSNFYANRFIRIFPAYLFALLLYYIFDNNVTFADLLSNAFCISFWVGKQPVILWYVSAIVAFYTFVPLYSWIYMKNPNLVSLFSIIISFLFVVLLSTLYYIPNCVDSFAILGFARVPLFLIGFYIGNLSFFNKSFHNLTIWFAIGIMFIGFILLHYFVYHMQEYLWSGALFFHPFILIVPGLCILCCFVFSRIEVLRKCFSFFGQNSLEIYLLNEFLLYQLHYLTTISIDRNVRIIIMIIINILCSVILSKIITYFTSKASFLGIFSKK